AHAKDLEAKFSSQLSMVQPSFAESAKNLVHYLALRQHDLRDLQSKLDDLGVSALGQAEAHVMANVVTVKDMLRQLIESKESEPEDVVVSMKKAAKLTKSNTNALLGKKLKGSSVRIMVTLPTDAAEDKKLVRKLISTGMNSARINCAHDDKEIWKLMIEKINKAKRKTGRNCKICMDLGGPKLRTGSIKPGPKVVHLRPERDYVGNVTSPSRVWLASPNLLPPSEAELVIPVPADWLSNVRKGDEVRFKDARGKRCVLSVGGKKAKGRWAKCYDSAYVVTGTKFVLYKKKKKKKAGSALVLELLPIEQSITLKIGDTLILHKDPVEGEPTERDVEGNVVKTAHISCTLPEIFEDVRVGEPILLDDGKISGTIRSVSPEEVHFEVTHAREEGTRLAADKGINFPSSNLHLRGLTQKDREDLRFIAEHADVVSMSFVNTPEDVFDLLSEIDKLEARRLGIILKIETQRGFRNLPAILLAGMRAYPVGVMIARGDLAIEVGFERMAEIQEEILWICAAAHIPVVWATQVLEKLAKKGLPTRAEITDAAMGQRAECVMLNKGPYILEAVRVLDGIMQRMQAHQSKKRPMLRKLALADNFRPSLDDSSQVQADVGPNGPAGLDRLPGN
ncbi:MAG: pyruvate kinase, partial [Ignavibacteria bacterium]|nr:pyruvate kinase [Ignavibacteria bacterium]